jgi:hypothetical protein
MALRMMRIQTESGGTSSLGKALRREGVEVGIRACSLMAEIKSERMAFTIKEITNECNPE